MAYWWESDPKQRYWVEIRKVPGIGTELWSPTRDQDGGSDPWYDLVASVTKDEIIYHWNAREHRFVGRSRAGSDAIIDIRSGHYRVPLSDFEPFEADVSLTTVRSFAADLYKIRDELRDAYGNPLYLPFQFTSDRSQFRFMSNYFAKLPHQMVRLLFGVDETGRSNVSRRAAEDEALGEDLPEDDVANSKQPLNRAFLPPFRPKADTSYVTNIVGGRARRDRRHETLVNSCAVWLASKGLVPGCNAAIDLGVAELDTIIEAKVVRYSWAGTIREAVGQLYEYRYFKVARPTSRLILLANQPVPQRWISYLEHDRNIGVMWPTESGYHLTRLAAMALKL